MKINERKVWTDPPPADEARRAIQDEQIFQTAKLIKFVPSPRGLAINSDKILLSCGHFMAAIMGDYVAGFLGSSEGCNWNMNAFDVSGTFTMICQILKSDILYVAYQRERAQC